MWTPVQPKKCPNLVNSGHHSKTCQQWYLLGLPNMATEHTWSVWRFMWPSMRCTMFWSVSGHLKCAKQSVVSFKVTLMYILFSSQTKDMLIYCKLFYFHIKMMTTKWFKSVSLKSFPKLCNVKNETNCSYISIFNMTRRYSKIGMFNIQVNSSLILVLF